MDYNYQQNATRLKKLLFISVLVVAFVVAMYWLATHSFIVVSLPASNEKYTITLTNQTSGKQVTVNNSSQRVKKLVSKGSYEVLVRQGTQTSLTVINTAGFLRTTHVNATLQHANNREFVGNNPLPCMAYHGQLLSYVCQDYINNVSVHKPANTKRPTYVERSFVEYEGEIEDQLVFNNKLYVLLHTHEDTTIHSLFSIQDGQLIKEGGLKGLTDNKLYNLRSYQNGFVALAKDLSEAYYYPDIKATPQPIPLNPAKQADMQVVGMEAGYNLVIRFYSNTTKQKNYNLDQEHSRGGITEVSIHIDNTQYNITFPNIYQTIKPCAKNTLCLLNGKELSVFNVSDNKPQKLYVINDVRAIENTPGGFVVVRSGEVIGLNAPTGQGYASYTFNDYQYCGIQATTTGYVLCVINNRQEKVALAVNMNEADKDFIDQKVSSVLKVLGLKSLSIYKKHIYIVQDTGALKYNSKQGIFVPDSAVIRVNTENIRNAIKDAGIDTKIYSVYYLYN